MNIIEGLPVDVPAEEVKALCEARAAYHESKEAAYRAQQTEIQKLQADEDHPAHTSLNAARDLQGKASEHRNRAAHLRFVADHLVPGATYRLKDAELVLLGVKTNRY